MKRLAPDAAGLAEAVQVLKAGRIVAHPTETVYGLAVDPFSVAALERLYEAKGRDPKLPLVVIVGEVDQVLQVAAEVTDRARRFMDRFWPGPLSLVLPCRADLPDQLTGGRPTVAVRCPGLEIARELCRAFGGPLTSTSANLSGKPPAQAVDEVLLEGIDLVLDGGTLPEALPSTVFDPNQNIIYREGAITKAMLDEVPLQ